MKPLKPRYRVVVERLSCVFMSSSRSPNNGFLNRLFQFNSGREYQHENTGFWATFALPAVIVNPRPHCMIQFSNGPQCRPCGENTVAGSDKRHYRHCALVQKLADLNRTASLRFKLRGVGTD